MAINSKRKAVAYAVYGALPPHSTNVLWMDTHEPETPVLKMWWNGAWITVQDAIDNVGLKLEIVNELPAKGDKDTIYLVPSTDPRQRDVYVEYVYVNNAYEMVGPDMAQYLSNYYTKPQIQTMLLGKQDTLTAGNNINIANDNTISALGYTYNATKQSFAEGTSTASGSLSHAEGDESTASGHWSHAEGVAVTASGVCSHAEGSGTEALGEYSHAEGNGTVVSATSLSAHAEGQGSTAEGNYSHAEGRDTVAYGTASHAEGYETKSRNDYSHVEGYQTDARGKYSHTEGYKSEIHPAQDSPYNTPFADDMNGYAAHVEGNATLACGSGAHAEGKNTVAFGYNSHAEGVLTSAGGVAAHSEGEATKAIGDNSHSEGYGEYFSVWTPATIDSYDHTKLKVPYIEGNSPTVKDIGKIISTQPDSADPGLYYRIVDVNTSSDPIVVTLDKNNPAAGERQWYMICGTAGGDASHVEGVNNVASGAASHAEGAGNLSLNDYAHTEGDSNAATGQSSHVEGGSNTATGECSHAEGAFTVSGGMCSHTEGFCAEAQNSAEHAEGHYNVSNKASDTYGNAGNTQHSIGIGTGSDDRKNAVEVMQNGDVYIFGVGNYEGTDIAAAGNNVKTLQTVITDNTTEQITITDSGSASTTEMIPNKIYIFSTRSSDLVLTLGSPVSDIANEYHCFITIDTTVPTITWPSGISWNGGNAPTIAAGKTYEISIMNNIAVYLEI